MIRENNSPEEGLRKGQLDRSLLENLAPAKISSFSAFRKPSAASGHSSDGLTQAPARYAALRRNASYCRTRDVSVGWGSFIVHSVGTWRSYLEVPGIFPPLLFALTVLESLYW